MPCWVGGGDGDREDGEKEEEIKLVPNVGGDEDGDELGLVEELEEVAVGRLSCTILRMRLSVT